jgi:hypothetical protein
VRIKVNIEKFHFYRFKFSVILAGRLRDWLTNSEALSSFQPGFVRGKRTTDEGKGKVIPLHAMEAHGVRGGIAPTLS